MRRYYIHQISVLVLTNIFLFLFIDKIRYRNGNKCSSVVESKGKKLDKTRINESGQCRWIFDHYSPSPWELYWHDNITQLQNKVCSTLKRKDQVNRSISLLNCIIESQKKLYQSETTSKQYDDLLSKMYYRYECSQSSEPSRIVSQYIDPLVGLLRDPLTICNFTNIPTNLQLEGEYALQSKRLFLLGPSAPYQNFHSSKPSIAPWLYKANSQKNSLRYRFDLFYRRRSRFVSFNVWYALVLRIFS